MKAKVAYEAYREKLCSRTRNWHELKLDPEHLVKTPDEFDTWLKENKSSLLQRFFMGNYEAMPSHTQAGWVAFAENAEEGEEIAWTRYVAATYLNFHRDRTITLPSFGALDPDQQEALRDAVNCVLETKPSFRY